MTSVDELFKVLDSDSLLNSQTAHEPQRPPAQGQKRKLEAPTDPNELYKSVKVKQNGDARNGLQATAEDEENDTTAGPELPPDFDEDENEDEEGRFFAGGISEGTAQVMDFVEEQDQGLQKAEKIDAAWLRKTALNFEKKISKNAELRAKYEGDPSKFMASEADLDESVKALSILSENPELYPEFATLGCLNSLVSLLSHENTDIAIDTMQIIDELTDEDVSAEQAQWDTLVDALLEADLLDLLHQNIARLDETNESDRTGIYHILGILESLSSNSQHASTISRSQLPTYLLTRSLANESPVTQNKQYAAEVLAILLQSSPSAIDRFLALDGVDEYLQALAPYRKREPSRGTEEEEFVENLFACLICAVDTMPGKTAFLAAEGPELCLIMIREGKAIARPRALRLLDHLLSTSASGEQKAQEASTSVTNSAREASSHLINAAALKPLFTVFMNTKKQKQDGESTEHLLGIFASLLRHLPAESSERIRLLGKFYERDYEKITRLLGVRGEYSGRLAAVEREIREEKEKWGFHSEEAAEMEELWLSRRLDAGLVALQSVDTILAWLVAEDDGARSVIRKGSEEQGGLEAVSRTLEGVIAGMSSKDGAGGGDQGTGEEGEVRDMLETLVEFLR